MSATFTTEQTLVEQSRSSTSPSVVRGDARHGVSKVGSLDSPRAHRDHGLRPRRVQPGEKLGEAWPHRRGDRPRLRGLPPTRPRLCGQDRQGCRLRSRGAARGRYRGRRRVRRCVQWGQLQHLVRPGGTRDLRRGQRRRSDLRSRPRRGVRAARDSDRRDRAVDLRSGTAAVAARWF